MENCREELKELWHSFNSPKRLPGKVQDPVRSVMSASKNGWRLPCTRFFSSSSSSSPSFHQGDELLICAEQQLIWFVIAHKSWFFCFLPFLRRRVSMSPQPPPFQSFGETLNEMTKHRCDKNASPWLFPHRHLLPLLHVISPSESLRFDAVLHSIALSSIPNDINIWRGRGGSRRMLRQKGSVVVSSSSPGP